MEILVYITCKDKAEAKWVAKNLVEKKLIACANMIPIDSIYRWNNAIEESEEILLLAKTLDTHFDELATHVKQLHSYEVPCIVSLPIKHGSHDYLTWIANSVAHK